MEWESTGGKVVISGDSDEMTAAATALNKLLGVDGKDGQAINWDVLIELVKAINYALIDGKYTEAFELWEGKS